MKSLVWLTLLAASFQVQGPAQQAAEPFATMEGPMVTLHPSNATFQVPDEVMNDRRAAGFTRYLTRAELERIKTVNAPNWDQPYSQVLNALLPFSACAVHLGTEPWGLGSKSFGDLQVRVYVIDGPAAAVRENLAANAVAEMQNVFPPPTPHVPAPVLTTPATGNDWSQSRISYLRNGGDFAAGVNLDFYVREFGGQTVVLFFHTLPRGQRTLNVQTWDAAVSKIVDSFTWPK